jgi:hypothetical protein
MLTVSESGLEVGSCGNAASPLRSINTRIVCPFAQGYMRDNSFVTCSRAVNIPASLVHVNVNTGV